MQPGQVITPGSSNEPLQPGDGAPEPVRPPEQPSEPVPSPSPLPEPDTPIAESINSSQPAADPTIAQSDAPAWQFQHEVDNGAAMPANQEALTWTASEFIEHEKTAGWYGLLALAGVVLAALIYFLTKDKITTGIILFAAIALGIFGARKPRTQQYGLDSVGIHVGAKTYDYMSFKAFSVVPEGAVNSVVFLPLKRFMPSLTIYVAPEVEDRAVDFLADRLPLEQHKPDAVDSFLRRIHF